MLSPISKILFFVNVLSGRTNIEEVIEHIDSLFESTGFVYEILVQETPFKAEDVITSALINNFDMVIVVGGDGTISSIANCIAHTHLVMGIVPTGTGNVLARELGIPTNVRSALNLISSGRYRIRELDGMKVFDSTYFICVSVGLSALIMKDMNSKIKRFFGRLAYFWKGLVNYLRYKDEYMILDVDYEHFESLTSDVLITNFGQKYIPGFNLSPDIEPDDGRLDVFIFKINNIIKILKILIRITFKKSADIDELRHFKQAQTIMIDCVKPMPVQADGDVVGVTPVKIQIAPNALRVIAPL
jgi:diacylglycerol kinase (ATP)